MHMTTDLVYLIAAAVLTLTMPTVVLAGRMAVPGGVAWALGNRHTPLEIPAWAERAQRAHANMIENLAPFAILVLAAHAAGKTGDAVSLGAAIFFWARVGHFLVYTAGVIGVRTALFFVGLAGEIVILAALLA